ncbi:unnamed protein product [Adineta ricciae]|uniref:Uncharacterized protein n=1 Tax=Adineta ricciae TaxID=249248 RepID=A0A814IGT3_ADIRI|nr:unnamed protein product [Adineta ricciae]
MSMIPDLYESISQFEAAGGHVRRRIVLHVKDQYNDQKKRSDDCRLLLTLLCRYAFIGMIVLTPQFFNSCF